jgi:MFS family permease
MKKLKGPVLFVVLIGIISLFSDMVYEGARGITGPFLDTLHANAFIVGLFAGLGEFIGYGLRLISGIWADRTKKYWTFVFSGYALNLLSVPLLALAGYWQIAVVLMMAERLGKAIRTPSRDALMAGAAAEMGRGWAFGLHEALDQIGATLGPLIMMAVLYLSDENYPTAFAWTLIPALLALSLLFVARRKQPSKSPVISDKYKKIENLPELLHYSPFLLYLAGAGFLAAGFTDFPLVAFHLKHNQIANYSLIPALYAMAMIVDAMAALALGKLYDRYGIIVLIFSILASLAFPLFTFSGSLPMVVIGVSLWGLGMGAQESILRAIMADLAPAGKVATVFGWFNTVFGIAWFAGSAVMGALYQISLLWLIVFSMIMQLAAISLFVMVFTKQRHGK